MIIGIAGELVKGVTNTIRYRRLQGQIVRYELAQIQGPQFEITSIPTLMIIKDGKVTNKAVGALPREAIEALI